MITMVCYKRLTPVIKYVFHNEIVVVLAVRIYVGHFAMEPVEPLPL